MKESRMENLFNNSIVLHHEAVRQKEQKKKYILYKLYPP